MKKSTLLLTLLLFGVSIFYSQDYNKKEKILCKTWYVASSIDVKIDGSEQKDRTKKAKGTEFIFKQDHTLDFIMKSRDKQRDGKWKFIGEDSLSIDMSGDEIVFYLSHFSKDSMHIIGVQREFKTMHVAFSSSYIAPYKEEDSETNYTKSISDNKIVDKSIEGSVKEKPLSKKEIEKLICKTWNLHSANYGEEEELEGIDNEEPVTFIFNKDKTCKLSEDKEDEEIGKWMILNDLTLNIEAEGQILAFKVLKINENTLLLLGKDEGVTFRLLFKTKQ